MATRVSFGGGGPPGKVPIRLVSNPPSAHGNRTFGQIVSQWSMKNSVVYNVLKVAWARYGTVKTTKVDDRTMAFEFQSENEEVQIMDMSPWLVKGTAST